MKQIKMNVPAVLMLAGVLWLTSVASMRAQRMGGAMGGSPQGPVGGQTQPGMNNPGVGNGPNGMGQQNNLQATAERDFLGTLQRNNKAETELSKLAVKNSSNDGIKKFAQQVITENHRTGTSLTSAAGSNNLGDLSTNLPGDTKKALKEMKKQTGTQFDGTYLSQMDGYIKNDQKTTANASALQSSPDLQATAAQLRNLADSRAQQLAQVAQSENFKLQ